MSKSRASGNRSKIEVFGIFREQLRVSRMTGVCGGTRLGATRRGRKAGGLKHPPLLGIANEESLFVYCCWDCYVEETYHHFVCGLIAPGY